MDRDDPLRLLVAVDGGNQRVDDAFDQAVRQAEHEEARKQQHGARVIEQRRNRAVGPRSQEHQCDPTDESERGEHVKTRMPTMSTRFPLMKIATVNAQKAGLKIRPICSFVM